MTLIPPRVSALLICAMIGAAVAGPVSAQDTTPPPVAPLAPAQPAAPQIENTAPQAPATIPAVEATPPATAPTPAVTPAPVPTVAQSMLPAGHDLSPMGMYEQAHWVVKAVMLSLIFACFVTWTVWLYKTVELILAARSARASHRILHGGASLGAAEPALARRRDPVAVMARAVAEEFTRSTPALDAAGPEGVKERAASLIERLEAQAAARIRRGTGLLATIGSTAPFVGLFGTVWGIMNAFIGIAETKTTNLAVVAPGIAEALLATAIGLIAAIPAVVIYNHFSRQIAAYRMAVGDAGAAVLRLLSRDIDFRTAQEG